VEPSRPAFTVIEPIQLAVTLRNAGSKPIVLWSFEGDDLLGTYLLDFELVRLDGRQRVPVKMMRPSVAAKAGHPHSVVTLAPNQSWSAAVNLASWLKKPDSLTPGRFEVRAHWEDSRVNAYGKGRSFLGKNLWSGWAGFSFGVMATAPADAIEVQDALGRPDSEFIKIVARLVSAAPPCPPCPEGHQCEQCLPPYATFGRRLPAADGSDQFSVSSTQDLSAIPTGTMCLIEGRWTREGSRRFFLAWAVTRLLPTP
jgi:hypothetical protein